jgi:CheY-like chemotaxis protein
MSALKVLIFEYDRPFADALERAFARRGCSVRVVDDGQVGLDVALDDRPGLIILAIELPRMNGFAVCNRIKKHPDLKDIPLVIVSSDSPPETFEQHSKLRTRAEDYAHKPIDPEALIARAAAFVEIPAARDSEIMVDEEAIEEAVDDAPINLDDDMSGLSDAAFDSIVLDSMPPTAPMSAASLLEPLPDPGPTSGRPAAPPASSDDFEDYTMVSSSAELPLNLSDIARAVQASPQPQSLGASAPPPRLTPPSLARVAPPLPPPSLPSFVPPAAAAPSLVPAPLPPQTAVAQLEAERLQRRVEELERELSAAQVATQRVVDLTEENQRLRAHGDELARVTREMEERLRASAPPALAAGTSPSRPGGVSTREFLELRESLNRKDKEILARDRELIELRDKLLQAEMSTADIDDRLAERDQEVIAARQAVEAARAELESEVARRSGFERALTEAREATSQGEATLRQQLAEAEARRGADAEAHQRELASLRAEVEASVAGGAAQAAQLAAAAAAEAALREEHARALEAARSESRALAQQGEAAARSELEAALEAARAEHSAALASLRSEHAAVVDSLRADYTGAVDAVKAEHGRTLEAKLAEHAAAAEALRSEHAAALEAARAEREQGLGALADEHATALAAAAALTAAAVAEEASTRRELTDRIAGLDAELSGARTQGAALASDLAAATARADEAARELASLRDRLGAMERRQASAEALLDRARQAMEIAAGLVHAAAHEAPAEAATASEA